MSGPEAILERQCVATATQYYKAITRKLDRGPKSKGWCDRIFFLPQGRVLLVEFKLPATKPEPMQDEIHRRLADRGHEVHVVRSYKQFCEILNMGFFDRETP